MKIRRLFVSHFKNLVDCELKPTPIHALTGCNGSGKSNLLQVLPFVSKLIAAADNERTSIFQGYFEGSWVPEKDQDEGEFTEFLTPKAAFRFELECEVPVNGVPWTIEYHLSFSPFHYAKAAGDAVVALSGLKIAGELLTAKEVGKPGKNRTLIERQADGATIASYMDSRARSLFSAQDDLSVLKILEVREPKTFLKDFPVIAAFRESLLATDVVRLDAPMLVYLTRPDWSTPRHRSPGEITGHFPLFEPLKSIKQDPEKWAEYRDWMRILCDIDDITLFESPADQNRSDGATNDPQKSGSVLRYILFSQHGRMIFPYQLSTGHTMIFGILTALFTFLQHNGPVFIEEPESYLHPKAIGDLLKALREMSDKTTVLISTHSPVLLNDLKPDEVTLMMPASLAGYFTTKPVTEIEAAIATIKRGYLTVGDLLQTNFTTDDKESS